MRKVLVVFLLAVIAGYVGARFWESGGSGERDGISQHPVRDKRSGDGETSVDPIHWARTARPVPARDLSEWSEQQIRAALDEGVTDPGVIEFRKGRFPVVGNLFSTWMKKNPDAAFAWFKELRSETMQRKLASALAHHWPKDRIDEGMEYLIANREIFEEHGQLWTSLSWKGIVDTAFAAAADKGPEELMKLLGVLNDNQLQEWLISDTEFPENFDFRKLVALLSEGAPLENRSYFFAAAWVSRRPEEAFDEFVTRRLGLEKTDAADLFSDVLPAHGEENPSGAKARARWLASKLDAMPEEQQRKVVMDLLDRYSYRNGWITMSVIGHLEDPDLKNRLLEEGVRHHASRLESTLSFIGESDDVAWRVEQLKSPNTDRLTMEKLTPVDEKLLREKLVSWKVNQNEVEAIVRRFKGGGQ